MRLGRAPISIGFSVKIALSSTTTKRESIYWQGDCQHRVQGEQLLQPYHSGIEKELDHQRGDPVLFIFWEIGNFRSFPVSNIGRHARPLLFF